MGFKHADTIFRLYLLSDFGAGFIMGGINVWNEYNELNGLKFLIAMTLVGYMAISLLGHHLVQLISKLLTGENRHIKLLSINGLIMTFTAFTFFALRLTARIISGNFEFSLNECISILLIISLGFLSYWDIRFFKNRPR